MLMSLLLASVALAQAGSPELPDAPQPQASALAQSEKTPDANAGASDENTLIGQAGRYPRFPRRPVRPSRGYAYRPAAPMPGLSPVGALIGFGVGAGLGARGSQDGSASARVASGLIIGAIGALIGGAIGAAPPLLHARRHYPPSGPDDDDDSDLHSDAIKVHSGRTVSASPTTSGQAPGKEGTAVATTDEPTVPQTTGEEFPRTREP